MIENIKNISIEHVSGNELEEVKKLLVESGLPSEDIADHLETFLMAKADGNIIGAVGLEIWGSSALLRSLVVKSEYRNLGIGVKLYNSCIELAKTKNINQIGLLTTTAEGFFAKEGFEKVAGDTIPVFIKSTKEYKIYCPSSSAIMIKTI